MDCSGLLNDVGYRTLLSHQFMAPHVYVLGKQNNSKPISIQHLFTLNKVTAKCRQGEILHHNTTHFGAVH